MTEKRKAVDARIPYTNKQKSANDTKRDKPRA